jgi:dephospho-CoA kinase
VIDADILARQVVEPGTQALKTIIATFGTEILQEDGTLDRKKLGTIIFNDEGRRKLLNKIVHPAVRRAMFWKVLGYWFRGHRYCVLDIPLLIEAGLWKWVGLVVVVSWYDNLAHHLYRLLTTILVSFLVLSTSNSSA